MVTESETTVNYYSLAKALELDNSWVGRFWRGIVMEVREGFRWPLSGRQKELCVFGSLKEVNSSFIHIHITPDNKLMSRNKYGHRGDWEEPTEKEIADLRLFLMKTV